MTIPMTIYLPDFNKDDIEITLESEGIPYEYASDNIIICQADAELYEFLMGCRKIIIKHDDDKPEVTTPLHEEKVEVEIPDCIPADENAAAAAEAAAKAIEEELKKEPKETNDIATKRSLVENLYRVLHNRKILSVSLADIQFGDIRNEYSVQEVFTIKGETNVVGFKLYCLEGHCKGMTKNFKSERLIKQPYFTVKMLREILKSVNHSF